METLSLQIYNAVTDKDVGKDLIYKQRAIWIWTFLLGRLSAPVLQSVLQEIEQTFRNDRLENQQLLELSWKAESVELLLREVAHEAVTV